MGARRPALAPSRGLVVRLAGCVALALTVSVGVWVTSAGAVPDVNGDRVSGYRTDDKRLPYILHDDSKSCTVDGHPGYTFHFRVVWREFENTVEPQNIVFRSEHADYDYTMSYRPGDGGLAWFTRSGRQTTELRLEWPNVENQVSTHYKNREPHVAFWGGPWAEDPQCFRRINLY
jgi:hypothetical protein